MTRIDDLLLGESAPMRQLRALIVQLASSDVAVLIQGETGTGKELVATALHDCSGRRGALVSFNVCAIPESMFEDSLFGHAKGAYTGAIAAVPGFLREAHNGTAFFDEISALPLMLQAKLLRAIETGVFRPVGGAQDVHSHFRVIAASNEGLDGLVDDRRFRADLAHRLSGVVLHVPSLRDRAEDIGLLATHFAATAISGRGKAILAEAIARLHEQTWPGNVRELRQVITAAALMSDAVIDAPAIEWALSTRRKSVAVANRAVPMRTDRDALVATLESHQWNVDRAAADHAISRATLYRRMRQHGVTRPRLEQNGGA